MITCRELLEFLAEYVDGTLPGPQREVFEAHLRLCPPCVDYLKMYRAAIELGKRCAAGDTQAPPAMPEALKKAILEARRGQANKGK